MNINRQPPIFEDRTDAGRCLAKQLEPHVTEDTLVVGVARGGIAVAVTVAKSLSLPWNVVVVRKLPVPWYPQAGFGAVAADGSVVLNESMLCSLGMSEQNIDQVVKLKREDAARQAELYANYREPTSLHNRSVILVDDVLISGYTMLAAIKFARKQDARNVIVASPVASRHAAGLVELSADECVFEEVSPSVPFSPTDFYLYWPQLDDAEILRLLGADRARM